MSIFGRMIPGIISLILPAVFIFVLSTAHVTFSYANPPAVDPNSEFKAKINANTVTILGGSITGTYLRLIDDISRGIGDGDKLRILPIRGGVVTNVRDILYLRGIDMGIIRADVIETYRGKKHYNDIKNRLSYISVLHAEEFHLMTSNPDIKSINDLKGKTVAFHNETYLSGQIVLNKLGIRIGKLVKTTMFAAAAKTRTGEYDAILRVTGKPFSGVSRLLKLDPNLRMIPIPYSTKLINTVYFPSKISPKDYPKLLPDGKEIETIAVHAILGVYNWKPKTDRYRRLTKFTNAFFSKYEKIVQRKGRHPKWGQINLAAKLNGWNRFGPAEKWLKSSKLRRVNRNLRVSGGAEGNGKLLEKFQQFLQKELPDAEAKTLFSDFKRWRDSQQ